MSTIILNIKTSRLSYELTLQSKFTIIRGNSGTGKTTLTKIVGQPGTRIQCQMPVEVMPTKISYLHKLSTVFEENYDEPHIFIVDEDAHYITSKEFQQAAKESKHLFILITRNRLASLPYATSDIWQLVTTRDTTRLYQYEEATSTLTDPSYLF